MNEVLAKVEFNPVSVTTTDRSGPVVALAVVLVCAYTAFSPEKVSARAQQADQLKLDFIALESDYIVAGSESGNICTCGLSFTVSGVVCNNSPRNLSTNHR